MPKAIVKLFRDPAKAAKAAEELKSQGFKAEEIGLLVSDENIANKLGTKTTADIGKALSQVEDIPEEAVKYYEQSASLGGILISVKGDEASLDKAQGILRQVDFADTPNSFEMWSSSPAFPIAEKMSATDPLDAKMSGDFRKY
jgi:uncharacterized protein YwqG